MRKTFLYSLMDFIEKFGARTASVEERILIADAEKAVADRHYMQVELDQALIAIQAALDEIREADGVAARMKDSALFQVYLIEWLAVTGVSLLAGSSVYALMIRRRAYREIRTTRFREDL
jgi:hypothetical protein